MREIAKELANEAIKVKKGKDNVTVVIVALKQYENN